MRWFQGLILSLSCATLLLLQMVGLHLHTNPDAALSGLHAVHVHGADPDGHDHSSDVDVAMVEYGTVWTKLAPLLLHLPVLLVAFVLVRWLAHAWFRVTFFPDTFTGWRPPLRAPPVSA